MFDITRVCDESYTGLTKDIIFYIFEHYEELMEEYMND